MKIVKVFANEESQAVQSSKSNEWSSFITALGMFTDDYMREPPEELPL